MNKWQYMVIEFHKKFGREIGSHPENLSKELNEFRFGLIAEEVLELRNEIDKNRSIVKITDALVDILYVTIGTAVSMGIDLDEMFEIVHNANMKKEGGAIRPDGKVLKPPGWIPPEKELLKALIRQGYKKERKIKDVHKNQDSI